MRSAGIWLIWLAVVMIGPIAGCGSDSGEAGPHGPTAVLETYNTGLAPGLVPESEARLQPVAQAVAESSADVQCLQEVWALEDDQGHFSTDQIDTIVNAASASFPHIYYAITLSEVVGGDGAFGGHNGLMLLSRHDLRDTEFITFESTILQRAALHAQTTLPAVGDVDVYCTHLTARQGDIPYPGEVYAGYYEEQRAQIQRLLEWIDQTATTGRVVVLGDMNTGPGIEGLQEEFPSNYDLFVQAGYRAPYLALDDPQCTYCGYNTLNELDQDRVVDHIFVDQDLAADVLDARRVFEHKVSIETASGATRRTNLSDHFGVQVELGASPR